MRQKKRSNRTRWAALFFVFLLVGMGVTGYFYGKAIERKITGGSSDIDPLLTKPKAEDPINVLLIGSDKRPKDDGKGRSDTLMVLRVNPQKKVASVISIPRDTRVYISGHGYDKINAAYSIGGPKLAIKTVEDFTGIELNHYVEIDFQGFKKLVDALGGIDIDVKPPKGKSRLKDYEVELDLPAGRQHLDGETALKFVRVRYVDDDFGRAGRQQQFLKAVFEKATKPAALAKLPQLISIASDNVHTDSGFGVSEMYKYGQLFRTIPKSNLRMATLPGEARMIGAVSYVVPLEDKVEWLLGRMKNDQPFELTADELANAEIVVDVLNGSGTAGQGREMAQELKVKGFTIGEVANAESFGYDRTEIRTSPEGFSKAKRIRDALGLGEIVSDASGTNDVTVIVGRDFAWRRQHSKS